MLYFSYYLSSFPSLTRYRHTWGWHTCSMVPPAPSYLRRPLLQLAISGAVLRLLAISGTGFSHGGETEYSSPRKKRRKKNLILPELFPLPSPRSSFPPSFSPKWCPLFLHRFRLVWLHCQPQSFSFWHLQPPWRERRQLGDKNI